MCRDEPGLGLKITAMKMYLISALLNEYGGERDKPDLRETDGDSNGGCTLISL